jgi:RHS repeat-associated protein
MLRPRNEQLTETDSSASTLVWQHTNVYAAGTLLATYDLTGNTPNDGLHFYFNDPLGTRRAQTDSSGVLEQTCSSLPFGDGLNCFSATSGSNGQTYTGSLIAPTEHHFTGKERDTESGNDYFGARYYTSSMGRFMSPDPSQLFFADPTNPQSLNLYSYVRNNPLINKDSTGMYCDYSDHDDPSTGFDPKYFDYHSSTSECNDSGGTWVDDAYTHNGMDDGDRPEYAVSSETHEDVNGVPSAVEALNDGLGSSLAGWLADIPYETFFAIAPKTINGRKLSFENDPYRLFSTNYCGPGGGGDKSGTINSLCAVHDACFDQAHLDASVNVGSGGNSLNPGQVAAAQGCNQALYEGARRHPYEPGSAALQWWLTQGDKTTPFLGFYILYPRTAAKP